MMRRCFREDNNKTVHRMFKTVRLLLPALIPSWNFFDIIAPSPRVQFALLDSEHEMPQEWREFRPRPDHVSILQMLGRLFWNAKWNESMYVVSCAERIMEQPTKHSEDEILGRIIGDLNEKLLNSLQESSAYLQFRLVIVERQGDDTHQDIVFYSRVQPILTAP